MTLDQEYQQTIDDQRAYLLKLQDDFNKKCEDAKTRAQAKLKQIPEGDKEGREKVLKDQKAELEAALTMLKNEVDHSTKATMRKLEEIVRKKEVQILAGLEDQLSKL